MIVYKDIQKHFKLESVTGLSDIAIAIFDSSQVQDVRVELWSS